MFVAASPTTIRSRWSAQRWSVARLSERYSLTNVKSSTGKVACPCPTSGAGSRSASRVHQLEALRQLLLQALLFGGANQLRFTAIFLMRAHRYQGHPRTGGGAERPCQPLLLESWILGLARLSPSPRPPPNKGAASRAARHAGP